VNPRLRPPSVRSISASRALLGYPCRAATYSQVSHSRQPSGMVSAAVTVTRPTAAAAAAAVATGHLLRAPAPVTLTGGRSLLRHLYRPAVTTG
jgi:hypothetical protein